MRIFFILLFILASQKGFSQNFLWGNTMGFKNHESATHECIDKQGNTYVLGNFKDSILVGGKLLTSPNKSGFLVKYDYNGNVVWFKAVRDNLGNIPVAITTDKKSNLYILGRYTKVFFTPKDSLVSSSWAIYMAKYDTSGKFIWAKNLTNINTSSNVLIDKNNNFIYCSGVSDSIIISKCDSTLKQVWRTAMPCKGGGIDNISQDSIGNIYATGRFYGTLSTTKYKIINTSLINSDIFILKLDSAGNDIWLKKEGGKKEDIGLAIQCFKNGNFYLIGFYGDTAYFDNKVVTGSANGYNLFIAFYHADGKLQWVRKAYKTQGSCQPNGIDLFDNYLYIGGGYYSCTPVFGKHKLPDVGNSNLFFAKMDSLGTFLWSFSQGSKNGGSGCSEFKTDYQGSSICVGAITGNASFGNFTLNSVGYEDAFILKISDVSLYRDSLKKTQYCEGDSIIVPYRISGVIGPTNTFTAELSDSNGSFDSVYYVIGKVTTTKSGSIKCKLPKGLPYSTRYNIHVIADTPNVTSYFNPQTITIDPLPKLKVLPTKIYCYHQKDTLHASGGLGYLWLPNAQLSNNTIANPVFSADSSITYTVIAYNSLGCTDTTKLSIKVRKQISLVASNDTAICIGKSIKLFATATGGIDSLRKIYWSTGDTGSSILIAPKTTTVYTLSLRDSCSPVVTKTIKVVVRPPLQISVGKDIGICPGQPVKLKADAKGGDSLNYTFTWDKGLGQGATKTVTPVQSTLYRVSVGDGCTTLNDSDSVFVFKTNPLKIKLNITDTLLCTNQPIKVIAKGTGGDSLRYTFTWDNGLGTGDSQKITVSNTTLFRVILSDSCTVRNDTAYFKIRTKKPLKITLNNDTTICSGQSIQLNAKADGGDSLHYHFKWSNTVKDSQSIKINPTQTTTYTCTLTDGCGTPDSAGVEVRVRALPKLIILTKDTTVCYGEDILLNTWAKGGDSTGYIFYWKDLKLYGNKQNIKATATKDYWVVLDDKCSKQKDSAKISIRVRYGLLSPPQIITATYEDDELIHIYWQKQPTATQYILRNNNGTINSHKVFYNSDTTTTDTLMSKSASPVSYQLTATDSCNHILKTDTTTTLYLEGTDLDGNNAYLSWSAYAGWQNGVSKYVVQKKNKDGSWFTITTLDPAGRNYSDADFIDTSEFKTCYRVAAIRRDNTAVISNSNTVCLRYKPRIWLPNIFTPNGDPINGIYLPIGIGIEEFEMHIQSRDNGIIFSSHNIHNGWDGTYKGKHVPVGVYIAHIRIKTKDGNSFFKQNVTLVR